MNFSLHLWALPTGLMQQFSSSLWNIFPLQFVVVINNDQKNFFYTVFFSHIGGNSILSLFWLMCDMSRYIRLYSQRFIFFLINKALPKKLFGVVEKIIRDTHRRRVCLCGTKLIDSVAEFRALCPRHNQFLYCRRTPRAFDNLLIV